jgi:hypothetical protein
MGSPPLAALALQPQPQPNPMANADRMLQMKSLLQNQQVNSQEMQIRQQQLNDQQALTAAMKDADPTSPTFYDDLAKGVLKNGGSATAAMGVQQHALTIKKTVSDIQAQDAATGGKNLDNFINGHKAVGDALEGLVDPKVTPDDQLHDQATSTVNNLLANKILDPATAQKAMQTIQSTPDPATLRNQIDQMAKASMGAKAVAEQAQTQAKTAADQASQWKEIPGTGMFFNPATNETKTPSGDVLSPQMMESKYVHLQTLKNQGTQLPEADQAFMKAYEKQKTLVPVANFNLQNAGAAGTNGQPSAIAQAIANGSMKWTDAVSPRTPMSVKQQILSEVKQINPNFNSGDFAVEQAVKTEATSGAVGKQLLAIGTAREHMKIFSQLADALDNSDVQALNKIGNALGVQFGDDKATNLKIASQAFGGEVGRAFDGAGVIGKEREQAAQSFSDQLSKGQFKGAVQTVDALLAGKQKAAHAWFDAGTKAQPDFGQTTTPPAGGIPSFADWKKQQQQP